MREVPQLRPRNVDRQRWTALSLAVVLLGGCDVGGSSSGSGGAGACDAFNDAKDPIQLTLRVKNEGLAEVFLAVPCLPPAAPRITAEHNGSAIAVETSDCDATCGEDRLDVDPKCPSHGCVVRIDPEGQFEWSWAATELVSATMPSECYHASNIVENECPQRVALDGGTLSVSVDIFPSDGDPDCACALATDTDGACEVDESQCSLMSAIPTTFSVSGDLAEDAELTIAVE